MPLEVTEALAIKHTGPAAFPRKAPSAQMRGMAPFSACPLSLSPSVFLRNQTWLLCSSSRTGPVDCGLGLVDSFFSGNERERGSVFSSELGKCLMQGRNIFGQVAHSEYSHSVALCRTPVSVKMVTGCTLQRPNVYTKLSQG